MNHVDLFSGIGGFALAARWAEIETVAFCEKDTFCQRVLRKHWPGVPIYDEIRTLDLKFACEAGVDILTAGFPCQPFSVAGKRKGKEDDRYLWPETFRVIKECRPTWLILENVPGIVSHLDPILEDLENEGYAWQAYLIPACSTGAPHRRERLWIVANIDGNGCNSGRDIWQARCDKENQDGYVAAVQQEWSQFIPESWQTHSVGDWLTNNNHYSRNDDGLSQRVDRLKALGNSVVPQIPYAMMEVIKRIKRAQKGTTSTKSVIRRCKTT